MVVEPHFTVRVILVSRPDNRTVGLGAGTTGGFEVTCGGALGCGAALGVTGIEGFGVAGEAETGPGAELGVLGGTEFVVGMLGLSCGRVGTEESSSSESPPFPEFEPPPEEPDPEDPDPEEDPEFDEPEPLLEAVAVSEVDKPTSATKSTATNNPAIPLTSRFRFAFCLVSRRGVSITVHLAIARTNGQLACDSLRLYDEK